MSDAIKINLYDPVADKELWQTAQDFKGERDTVYVFVHGSPTQVADYRKGRENPDFLYPLELAQMLDEKGATRESRIFLFACTPGQGMHSFARELSQYYSVVEGATRQVWSRARSESEFYAEALIAAPDGQGQPDPNKPGIMKTYFGADYRFCNARPEKCDPPQSERPPPTHEFNLFKGYGPIPPLNVSVRAGDTRNLVPITAFQPGLASKPISPDEATPQRKVEAQLFLNIIELNGVQAQLARQQAMHHYPEMAYAFAAFDHSVQQSKRRTDSKEYLGEQVAAISLAIEQGGTYALDIGANAKPHPSPIVATHEYSR